MPDSPTGGALSDRVCPWLGAREFDLAILVGQDPGRAARRFDTAVKGHSDSFKRSRAISRTEPAAPVMVKGDPRQAAVNS
ncbi:hypothetical protein GA0115254_1185102 [Streptomyces sp. Ncost-T10-10d]|nr:hypothetical protein GA0115254_1185102 [Streptomyces sp. Ncost-T10-10d]